MTLRNALIGLVIAIGGLSSAALADKAPKREAGNLGQAAPDFKLKGVDGKDYSLADYKGKIVVLEWTNHKCPFVKHFVADEHRPQKISATYAGRNVVWLSIDSSSFCQDEVESIKAFRDENKVKYPLLLDPTGEVGKRYGAKTTPHVFVIDAQGRLVYHGAPDDDNEGKKDSPRLYVEEVIQALLKGEPIRLSTMTPYGCSVKYAG